MEHNYVLNFFKNILVVLYKSKNNPAAIFNNKLTLGQSCKLINFAQLQQWKIKKNILEN